MSDSKGLPAQKLKGITEVFDDLPAGAQLNIAGAFVRFFRPELESHFVRPIEKSRDAQSEKSEPL